MMFIFFLSSASLFFLAVQATVSISPSNSTLDLPGSSATYSNFRLWGSSYLNGQPLAPLTQSLLNLTDAQAKVCLALPPWTSRITILITLAGFLYRGQSH